MPEPASATDIPMQLSIEDYAEMPDDGRQYELINGELNVTPSPGTQHQRVAKRVFLALVNALESSGAGEVFIAPYDVELDRYTVVQPDLMFVRAENTALIGEKRLHGPPDLAVEILSPSTRRRDVLIKSPLYARFGVAEYWLVDPAIDRFECRRLVDGAYITDAVFDSPDVLERPAFPGLTIPLVEIFVR